MSSYHHYNISSYHYHIITLYSAFQLSQSVCPSCAFETFVSSSKSILLDFLCILFWYMYKPLMRLWMGLECMISTYSFRSSKPQHILPFTPNTCAALSETLVSILQCSLHVYNATFRPSSSDGKFPNASKEKTIPPELIYPGPFIFFLWSLSLSHRKSFSLSFPPVRLSPTKRSTGGTIPDQI